LRKRIAVAESICEELEANYVALRAHYILTTQTLQSAVERSDRTVQFLQSAVQAAAEIIALQRARLQMARDVAAALKFRTVAFLKQRAASTEEEGGAAAAAFETAAAADTNELMTIWNNLEEEI
jgi:hypothetical protein